MKAIYENIDKIYYSKLTDKQKIDLLLQIDAECQMNMGSDSTKKERSVAKLRSNQLYRTIKKIDEQLGTLLLNNRD
jgi:hypothetical protein